MVDINELSQLCESLECRITPECSLSEYITFRFGGNCRALISVSSVHAVKELLKYFKEKNIKYFVLGRGSNVIVRDEGFDGVVLLFGSDFANIETNGETMRCEAGASLACACTNAQQNGLTGMENLFGIPGTVGGAVYMNAGAYGSEMKDVVVSAEYIDEDFNLKTIKADEMKFSYRHSVFAENKGIIVSVTIKLSKGNPDEIRNAMNECMGKRRAKQPLEFPSAGSTFKRPGEDVYASKLIDDCGLKGFSHGGAMVSDKHCGFVINKGFATCADVLELCRKVQETVKEKTGYSLEFEPVILG